jgi:phosphoglycerate dehydrogenase-like enzyme
MMQSADHDPSIESRMMSLYDKIVAIIGYGSMGREIGARVRAFGAHVVAVASHARTSRDAQVWGPEDIHDVIGRSRLSSGSC